MGCTSGKEDSNGKKEFEHTKAHSIDSFFNKAQTLADNWSDGVSAVFDAKDSFREVSKFELEPNTQMGIGVVGMLLYFSSGLDGDTKVDFEIIDKDPYYKITAPAKLSDGAKMVESLTAYISAINSFVTETLPGL